MRIFIFRSLVKPVNDLGQEQLFQHFPVRQISVRLLILGVAKLTENVVRGLFAGPSARGGTL